MSIEVHVPIEIEDYKESVICGLSLRQLIWGSAALVCGISAYLLLNIVSSDLAVYGTMTVVIPAFCMGWIKKDGYTFEQILKIKLKAMLIRQKRSFETNPEAAEIPIEIEKYRQAAKLISDEENEKNRGDNVAVKKARPKKEKRKRNKTESKSETFRVEISKKGSERKRKTALKSIKEAGRSDKQKKSKNQKEKKS